MKTNFKRHFTQLDIYLNAGEGDINIFGFQWEVVLQTLTLLKLVSNFLISSETVEICTLDS